MTFVQGKLMFLSQLLADVLAVCLGNADVSYSSLEHPQQ